MARTNLFRRKSDSRTDRANAASHRRDSTTQGGATALSVYPEWLLSRFSESSRSKRPDNGLVDCDLEIAIGGFRV